MRRAVNVRSAPMFSAFCKASAMILAFSRLVSFVDFFSRQPSAVAKQAYQMGERLRGIFNNDSVNSERYSEHSTTSSDVGSCLFQRGKDVAASLGFEPSFYDSRPRDRLTPQCIAQRARGGFDAKDDKATSQWNVLK